jgi:D-alanine-D-alanine ligase-like ATP-grasp enzyme
MWDKDSSLEIEARKVTIKLVDGSVVKGKINLHKHKDEMIIPRMSEIFTKQEDPFVVVFEATFEGGSDRVLIINKHNIILVSPDD